MAEIVMYSSRVWIENSFQPATLFISEGKIEKIEKGKSLNIPDLIDYHPLVIMPGVIDVHVHINEPGRTEWEGFSTATKAAAAGGTTTLVDMPLNSSPVTINQKAFDQKIKASQDKLQVNVGFWGGLVPDNANDLEEILATGVLGMKAFLTHSGIDEFPNVNLEDLERAMPKIAEANIPLLAHCEIDSEHQALLDFENHPKSYAHFLASRPKSWENDAVRLMIKLCEKHHCPVHIVHLSSADVLEDIRVAKSKGLPLTVETCPQYLYFNAETIPDADCRFKCAPPIREKSNNEQLWEALKTGIIDFVATDHSPAPPHLKEMNSGNLFKAWGGISSLQLLLPIVWSKAKHENTALEQVIPWLTEKPAQFLNLQHRKGKILEGYDADLVVWHPEQYDLIEEKDVYHKHKICPYIGETLFGKIYATFVNGKLVFNQNEIVNLNQGKRILRNNK